MKKALMITITIVMLLFVGCDDTTVEPKNNAPVITSLTVDNETILIGDIVTLTCEATDEDGDALTYSWDDNGDIADITTHTIQYYAEEIGTFTIICIVSDSNGGEVSETIELTVSAQPFMGSYTLSGLALVCTDGEILLGTAPYATGSLTINDDFSFTWSTTLVDDEDGLFSECVGEELAVFTFTANGTIEQNGNILSFDVGEDEPWIYEWEIDEENTLILSDDESYFEFD